MPRAPKAISQVVLVGQAVKVGVPVDTAIVPSHVCKAARRELMQVLDDHPVVLFQVLQHAKILASGISKSRKRGRDSGITETPTNELVPWDATYNVHGKIPKYWVAQFMGRYLKGSFGDDAARLVNLVDKADGSAIRKIFTFATGITNSMRCPKALHDKATMELFYLQRLNALGGRLERVFKELVTDTGDVRWEELQVFKEHYEMNQSLVGIRHFSGILVLAVHSKSA